MNQTQEPSSADEQQSSRADQPGVDRQNLRNYEQLRRSVTDRKVAGVAGGLGRHLDIDPTLLRVLFVVLCFFGGAGFVLYGVAWLLVPEDGRADGKIATSPSTRNGLLIGAGVIAALLLVGDSWGGIGFPWPILLVGIGVLVYLAVRDKGPRPAAPGSPSYAETSPVYQPQPLPERGPKLFGFTLALVATALGALGLYDVSGGAVLDSAYPALALAVVGLMLVVGAVVGRAGGLIFLGLVAAVTLVVTSAVGSVGGMDFRDGEQVSVVPTSASSVRSDYTITSGRVSVDLSKVSDPEVLAGRVIDVSARAGEIVVILPSGVESDVRAGIDGPGQIDLPGRSSGGINTDLDETYGAAAGAGTVRIVTHLSAGHIDVRNPR